jgi:hypothetical protein
VTNFHFFWLGNLAGSPCISKKYEQRGQTPLKYPNIFSGRADLVFRLLDIVGIKVETWLQSRLIECKKIKTTPRYEAMKDYCQRNLLRGECWDPLPEHVLWLFGKRCENQSGSSVTKLV